MKKDTSGPAFPVQMHEATAYASICEDLEEGNLSDSNKAYYESTKRALSGMTLRDYFAAKTLSAIISGSMADGSAFDADAFSVMPKVAYMMADSMLKARAE